jgi:hypothetical protein
MIGWRTLMPLALVAMVGCQGEDVATKKMLEAERAENARLARELERSQRDRLIERAQKPKEPTPQEKEEALAQEAEQWRSLSEGQVSARQSSDLQEVAAIRRAKQEEEERVRRARQLEDPLVSFSETETAEPENEATAEEETVEPPVDPPLEPPGGAAAA